MGDMEGERALDGKRRAVVVERGFERASFARIAYGLRLERQEVVGDGLASYCSSPAASRFPSGAERLPVTASRFPPRAEPLPLSVSRFIHNDILGNLYNVKFFPH